MRSAVMSCRPLLGNKLEDLAVGEEADHHTPTRFWQRVQPDMNLPSPHVHPLAARPCGAAAVTIEMM